MTTVMPFINIAKVKPYVSDEVYTKVVMPIIASRGKNKGRLRASKPPIEYNMVEGKYGKTREPEKWSGSAAYVWRMVAFHCSPIHQHQCMPVMAFCDLPRDERHELEDELDKIVDLIIKFTPLKNQPGTLNWGRGLGMI